MIITEEIDVTCYLDDKNTNLFNRLSNKYTISLSKILESRSDGNDSLWSCRVNQNEASISYYSDIESTGSFTHELFHIDIIDKGFENFNVLVTSIKSDSTIEFLFHNTIGHINNILGHQKFYDDFLRLGYEPYEFVSDFNSDSNIAFLISKIDQNFNANQLPNDSISYFINSYFTAKDNRNPNKNKDYEELFSFLENKDRRLFEILNNHWTKWTSSETLNNKEILLSLFDETKAWFKQRNHDDKVV